MAYTIVSGGVFVTAGMASLRHGIRYGPFEVAVVLAMSLTWPVWMVYAFASWLTYPPEGRQ